MRYFNNNFVQINLTAILLVGLIALLKILVPKLEILQLSVELASLIALITFLLKTWTNATKKSLEAHQKEKEELRGEIREIRRELKDYLRDVQDQQSSLLVKIDSHIEGFGHEGTISKLFEVQQIVLRLQAEMAIKGDMVDLQDMLDNLEAEVSQMQSVCKAENSLSELISKIGS